MGNRMAYVVARKLKPDEHETLEAAQNQKPIAVQGTEGMVIQYAKCCRPIPGDKIIGHISSGRGLVIHRTECRNIRYMKDDPQKCIYLEWSEAMEGEFTVMLKLEVASQRGVIANLATTVSATGANILKIDMGDKEGQLAAVDMEIAVTDRIHLARAIKKLRALRTVSRVIRL